MTETAESHKIMRAFQHFYQTSIKIQRFFREQRMMDKYRLDLVRRSWEINKDRMQKTILRQGGKQLKGKLKKLQLLNDVVREQYIKMYFERQKLLFIIKFIENEGKNEMKGKIEKYQKLLVKFEKKLGIKSEAKAPIEINKTPALDKPVAV